MRITKNLLISLLLIFVALSIGIGIVLRLYYYNSDLISPFVGVSNQLEKPLPLNVYKIENLSKFPFMDSKIKIKEKIADFDGYSSYLFIYQASGGSISGQLNLPENFDKVDKVIVLLRGYVPSQTYVTGVGTKSAAGVFAKNGYITLSPDFLGYGQSDPESTNSWETRFIKSVNVIELIQNIEKSDFIYQYCLFNDKETTTNCQEEKVQEYSLGIWAHSNGGQVALTTLEALNKPIPTTLWAPVTAPFPYSILFFSDEYQDEGKATRKWLSQFEDDYDVFDFSISRHLDRLEGSILLHHGTSDEAALQAWSLEFIDKVDVENNLREENNLFIKEATEATELSTKELIDLTFYSYPGADHNMRPVWNSVISRDLEFFRQHL
jgi:cephalosporin-C deacetylase-like acetyl esterase